MYDFPEKAKLNELINQKLQVISCTANQIIFGFSDNIEIEVTGHLEHAQNSGPIQKNKCAGR